MDSCDLYKIVECEMYFLKAYNTRIFSFTIVEEKATVKHLHIAFVSNTMTNFQNIHIQILKIEEFPNKTSMYDPVSEAFNDKKNIKSRTR